MTKRQQTLALAQNRQGIAPALHRSGVAVLASVDMLETSTLITDLLRDRQALPRMSESAAVRGGLRFVAALAESGRA